MLPWEWGFSGMSKGVRVLGADSDKGGIGAVLGTHMEMGKEP